MSYSPYEPAPPERDRWGLNLPLAIGLVTVFLLAVIVWVIIDATRGDEGAVDPTLPPPSPTTVVATTRPTPTTTPPLLPTTPQPTVAPTPTGPSPTVPGPVSPSTQPSAPPATEPPPGVPPATDPSATTAPPTSAAGPGDTVPGDLAVSGRPMTRPVCTGGYITVIGSNVASRTSPAGIAQLLEEYPGSEYLRTDQSCPSLDRSGQGEPIYVVYFGPFPEASDACQARRQGPEGAYARRLSEDVGPDHSVDCD